MMKGFALGQVIVDAGGHLVPAFGPAHFGLLPGLGVEVVRLEFKLVPPPPGAAARTWATSLAPYKELVRQFVDRRILVIGLLGNQITPAPPPAWKNYDVDPADDPEAKLPSAGFAGFLEDYAAAVRAIVGDVPGITHWEIWNEPNSYGDSPPPHSRSTYIFPSLYAHILRRAWAEIKRLQPGTGSTVITGGLFGHNISNLFRASAGVDYLEQVLRRLIAHASVNPRVPARPFDAIGQHYYLDRGAELDPNHLLQYLDLLSPLADGTPVWITEVGWNAGPSDAAAAARQAGNLETFYRICRDQRHPRIDGVCCFTLHDDEHSTDPSAKFRGIYASDLSAKPAAVVFQALPGASLQERAAETSRDAATWQPVGEHASQAVDG